MGVNARQMGDFYAPDIGDRCPFCGKAWSDPSSCGDPEPGSRSWWSKRNVALFEIACANCGRNFTSTRQHARYCSEDCKSAALRDRRSR